MELPIADSITSLLRTFLDVQSRRAELASSNIANSETPGYTAKELDFAAFLRRAAQDALAPRAAREPIAAAQPRVRLQGQAPLRLDGNNVDLAREMATLAEAGTQFLTGVQLLQARLRLLRTAIREGR
ncbi:MAG: flagellar basal body rod protein FlgB [Pyrinomonas sp.]